MIDKIISIARESGAIIRNGFKGNFTIEFKSSESNLVTQIDKESERCIMDYIKKEFPGHGILSEESVPLNPDAENLWVVDPLDGTTNFAHGLPIFAVSIGFQRKGNIIAGVVYDVMNDVLYTAERGSGAYVYEKKLRVSKNDNINRSVLVTGFPYDITDNPDFAVERFTAFLKTSRAIRRLGSAAIDLCYVASGVFDGFWEVKLHPWDICAGKLIIEEAGGIVTDFKGNSIDIFSPQVLASNPYVHGKMIEILRVQH